MTQRYIYLGLFNEPDSSEFFVKVNVDHETEVKELDYLYLGIISSIGTVVLLIIIAKVIRCRTRARERRIQDISQRRKFSKSKADKLFPPKPFKKVKGQLNNLDESMTTCAICLDNFEDNHTVRMLLCKHVFHDKCIQEWFKKSSNCCLCKQDLSKADEFFEKTQHDEEGFVVVTQNLTVTELD